MSVEARFLNFIRRRKHWLKYGRYVTPELMSTDATRVAARGISALHGEKRGALLHYKWVLHWVQTHLPRKVEKVTLVLRKMRSENKTYLPRDPAIVGFVQRRVVEGALTEGIESLDQREGLDGIARVRDTIDYALRLTQRGQDFYPYFNTVQNRQGKIRDGQVAVGFSDKLDSALGGGLCPGELGIFMGPTGRGKSQVLCNVAAFGILQEHNVLYCTLQDLPSVYLARRVDQILLGWPESRIVRKPKAFRKRLKELQERCGQLFIRDFTDRTCSFVDLRSSVDMIEEKRGKLGLLVVDYLDTMVSHTKNQDPQTIFQEIITSLRALGREKGFPVWTAAQGNRESLDAEEVKLSQIAGAIAKVKAADLVIGMSQTADMKEDGYLVFNILKTRMASDLDRITIFSEPKTMRMFGKVKTGEKK